MRVDTKENLAKKEEDSKPKKKGKRKTGKQLYIAYALRTVTICVIVLLLVAIWKMISFVVGFFDKEPTQVMVKESALEYDEKAAVVFKEKDKIVIWLDAGHGGKDVGSDIEDIYEKEINVSIVNKIQKALAESDEEEEYDIQLTRKGDKTVRLYERVDLANEAKADLFVSIHCNSNEEEYVNGIETFYAEGDGQGKNLAQTVQDSMIDGVNAKDRGINTGNFVVLNHTNMPAVLIEVGFLSNEEEYKNLTDSDYQEQLAEAIAEGIEEFIKEEQSE